MDTLATLRAATASAFGHGRAPSAVHLTAADGYDVLDKQRARGFFSDKTWTDVLDHLEGLRDEEVYRAAYFLEEWSVLVPAALVYYARAYLDFLLETVGREEPDEEYVFHFLGELSRLLGARQPSPFSPEQRAVLRAIVQHVASLSRESPVFEYFDADIDESASKLLSDALAGDGSA